MNFQKSLAVLAVFLSLAAGGRGAQAQVLVTFGQYNVDSTLGNVYTFTNLGAGSTLVTATVPITFVYNVANSYGAAGSDIRGTLTLSSTVSGPAQSVGIPLGPTVLYQPLGAINLTLTANTPVAGKTNLLTVFNSTGSVTGIRGGTTASDTSDMTTGDNVNYSSDFLSFAGSTQRSFNISFTSVIPAFSQNVNGYLNSFTASGNGSFAYVPAPEPNSLLTLSIMGGCLALCIVRRKTLSA